MTSQFLAFCHVWVCKRAKTYWESRLSFLPFCSFNTNFTLKGKDINMLYLYWMTDSDSLLTFALKSDETQQHIWTHTSLKLTCTQYSVKEKAAMQVISLILAYYTF